MDVRENEAFTHVLRDAISQAEKLGYRPNDFKRMLDRYGGFVTVQRVLATGRPSDGFTRLWELGRLDLTCEALIVETEWRKYFDPALLARAESLLAAMNYSFTPYVATSDLPALRNPKIQQSVIADSGSDSEFANDMRINAFFREVLHAPVRNDRWSWGSTDEMRRRVFLRVWQEDVIQRSGKEVVRVLAQRHTNHHGWLERQQHLELVRNGYDAYAVLCRKASATTTRIGSFEASSLPALINLAEIGGEQYMTLGPAVDASKLSPLVEGHNLEGDLMEIRESEVSESTRVALVEARLGQGRFRRNLMRLWNGRCAVTGSGISALLRASHCKPWRDSNHKERLDPHNGLLLTANLDALFDALLISFDDDGEMLVSGAITLEECRTLELPARLLAQPGPELRCYLKHHRDRFNEIRHTWRGRGR